MEPEEPRAQGPAATHPGPQVVTIGEVAEPRPRDRVDEWGYESFPASDPPQH